MKLHRITTVTSFSKAVELILFIAIPIIAFLLGMQYQLQLSMIGNVSNPLQPFPVVLPSPTKVVLPVHIDALSPSTVSVGSQITLTGSGFTPTNNYIKLGSGYIQQPVNSDGRTLAVTIPQKVEGGCMMPPLKRFRTMIHCMAISIQSMTPGIYQMQVVNEYGDSNPMSVTVQ